MSFVGGKLRLKGQADIGGVKKKKKTKKKHKRRRSVEEEGDLTGGETSVGYVIRDDDKGATDRRTAAERRFDEKIAKREGEEIEKAATKTHRERVKEFNEKLANLSEHYDIPKVGPG